jgi:thiol-disulfide isomerase/thioredoxin
MNIFSLGYTNTIDSISKYLRKEYPSSIYLQRLDKIYERYKHLNKGEIIPDFRGVSFRGKTYDLREFKGKVVLIDVWATWCTPCKKGFPKIVKLIEKYEDEDIEFLFISTNSNEEDWKIYLRDHPELKGKHFRCQGTSFMKDYNITGIPRYIVIDKEGKIINAFATTENLSTLIEQGLNKD